jgi:hypothetical protein
MTNEELINRFSDNPYDDSLEAEILSRLNRLDEVEKENKRLSDREGNAKVNLIFPTETSPFRQVNLKTVDYGVSDNIYICESQEVEQLSKQVEGIEKKYQELIYAVEHKFNGETRHETALRYITERENSHCLEAKKADNLTRGERK